jgi:broad specificity phosphatase PhoE
VKTGSAVTTTFFLVRHATHGSVGRILVGRMPGVRLDTDGAGQAGRLAARLVREHIDMIQSSPRERARETAAPIGHRCGVRVKVEAALDEIDFGDWTGRPIAALDGDPRWERWNARRSEGRPPCGESMRELQARVIGHLEAIRSAMPNARVVMVSHAEPIRAAILCCLGIPLDDFGRVDIAPASITTIAFGERGRDVMALNRSVAA